MMNFVRRILIGACVAWAPAVVGCRAETAPGEAGGAPTGQTAPNSQSDLSPSTTDKEDQVMLTSSAFESGAAIPRKHTGEGEDLSPPLSWSEMPEGVKSFALICDDPDAPSPRRPNPEPWVHWVIYNIPSNVSRLPEGISPKAEPAEVPGSRQGANSWPSVGYRGPMPPPGSGRHRYFFKLYALDTELALESRAAKKSSLLKAMEGHILAEGQLMGTYERK